MKFIGFFIVAVLLSSCSLGNSSTNSVSPDNSGIVNFGSEKILSLCDIGSNPSNFDGKMVRLKTKVTFGVENNTFSDENCSYSAVANFANEDAYQLIDKIRKESSRRKKTLFYANVEVEGKFINQPFTRCCTKAPFYFEITKTYTAQPIEHN